MLNIFNNIKRLAANINRVARSLRSNYVLGRGSTQVLTANNTDEQVLATIVIPANSIGTNGRIAIDASWSRNDNSNNKILRARLGGIAGTQFLNLTTTTGLTTRTNTIIQNRGATNAQVSGAAANVTFGNSVNNLVTANIDTTQELTLVLTGQKAVGTDVLGLECYLVTLFPGD